jgi:CRISPR-associated endonuclease/helicase Cas3
MHYAHSSGGLDQSNWQALAEHLLNVAHLAESFGAQLGVAKAARLAGLLHDLGKYTPEFQARLAGSKERVDHSTAGAAIVGQLTAGNDRAVADLIAYAIAGHHAGLPDKHGPEPSTLANRLEAYSTDRLDPGWTSELTPDARDLLPAFVLKPVENAKRSFQWSLLGRMIFSCLVDADFRDTEQFYARIEGRGVDREWPTLATVMPDLTVRYDAHMARMRKADIPVNVLRGEILDHVRGSAGMSPGLFTLTVPTGGGKTLASLGFALDHARIHGHRRIIFSIPFTSIIDQTAEIFRNVLGDGIVLEHHSAIEEEAFEPREREGSDKLKLAMEDWAAPVVVTTNVQLFESLFASRSSRTRKLHNIAGSVIVLDEAQTLPRPLLVPAVWMIEALARDYGCTVVLCTATQPALDRGRFPDKHPAGLPLAGRELAPDPIKMNRAFKRVKLHHAGPMSDSDLINELRAAPKSLVVVNSRKHALQLYRAAEAAGLDGLIHLSTRQYAADRRRILDDVKRRLSPESGTPCRLIATSLVEAGVDLDFPRAWRAEAGLDQLMQAAGRVNREGRRPLEESIVTVFDAPDCPAPSDIRGLTGDMKRIMDRHPDLSTLAAMEEYFGEVYWRVGIEGLDRGRVDRQPIREKFMLEPSGTDFSYRSAAENFRMIESGMMPVIVPREDEARRAVELLKVKHVPTGLIARKLQSYIVQIPPPARRALIDAGHVSFVATDLRGMQFAALHSHSSLYSTDVGLVWENVGNFDDMII